MKYKVEIKSVNNEPESRFRASANIVLDDAFIIRNAKLFIAQKPYVVMPSIIGRSGKRFSPCHPVTKECHNELAGVFLDAYHEYNAENGLTEPEYGDYNESEPNSDFESESEDNGYLEQDDDFSPEDGIKVGYEDSE